MVKYSLMLFSIDWAAVCFGKLFLPWQEREGKLTEKIGGGLEMREEGER